MSAPLISSGRERNGLVAPIADFSGGHTEPLAADFSTLPAARWDIVGVLAALARLDEQGERYNLGHAVTWRFLISEMPR